MVEIPQQMTAIRQHAHGGPEVLQVEEGVAVPTPGPGQVLVRLEATGVNFIDTYFREGIYEAPLPLIPGQEGVGVVVAHGPSTTAADLGVSISSAAAAAAPSATEENPAAADSDAPVDLPAPKLSAVGTRVAFCDATGTYAQYCLVSADRVVEVPEGMDRAVAASVTLQGITAHYLARGVYELNEDSTCVITAGAGGVGQLLTQLAKHHGATVISLVSNDEKEEISRKAGADHVLRYEEYSGERVRELTNGVGVDVVYDGVGASTFATSLECIRPTGLMCLFGAASGPVDPIDPQILNKHGSLFLTRPGINAWTSREGEFAMRAGEILQLVNEGVLKVNVGAQYPLEQARQAHEDLQARKTVGSVVLLP